MAKKDTKKEGKKPDAAVPQTGGDDRPVIRNRQASFEYAFLDTYVAGIMLTGTEVKSIRAGKAQIADAFCSFKGDELYIHNMQVSPYEQGSYNNVPDKRSRKLLLNRTELRKLKNGLKDKGLTIVPVKLFFNARNLAKLEIALAKGKKLHDKRESIKARDTDRELRRAE